MHFARRQTTPTIANERSFPSLSTAVQQQMDPWTERHLQQCSEIDTQYKKLIITTTKHIMSFFFKVKKATQ